MLVCQSYCYFALGAVDEDHRFPILLLNHISFKPPNAPPLSQPHDVFQKLYCNSSTVSNCETEFCRCTHILEMKLGSLVEVILVDRGSMDANHPFHLHGYKFAVLGMEKVGDIITLEDVKNLDKMGKLRRNLIDIPLKDTVTVPDGGYTVIRLIADNPGYWLLHCHLLFHLDDGMAAIFRVGEQKDLPPVPSGFPKCGSWVPRPVYDLNAKIRKYRRNL
ncbi:Laccase-12 [Armadillidium vulgare]|nr:Laccase-12 [Armadillidium vulgare]